MLRPASTRAKAHLQDLQVTKAKMPSEKDALVFIFCLTLLQGFLKYMFWVGVVKVGGGVLNKLSNCMHWLLTLNVFSQQSLSQILL